MKSDVVGFTGSRFGMTEAQRERVAEYLRDLKASWFHHGDCVGADAQAHDIARAVGLRIVSHPPNVDALRAFTEADDERKPKAYLTRNRDIVNECEYLIAAPVTYKSLVRSGTWSTIRYAQRKQRRGIVVYPDGSSQSLLIVGVGFIPLST